MKKYLILLIVPLLFFSTGCEDELDAELGEVTNTVIDENLIGVWVGEQGAQDIVLTFSSNGGFSRTLISNFAPDSSVIGEFWVEDNILIMYGDFENFVYEYSISNDGSLLSLLSFSGAIIDYTKQ